MPFQFQCPNGHLLEALESQSGEHCNCPHCDVLLVIPEPPAGSKSGEPSEQPTTVDEEPPFAPEEVVEPSASEPAEAFSLANPQADLLSIPCPAGHILEVPVEMLDQYALCPHCNAEFFLRRKNSLEEIERRERRLDAQEERIGRAWLNWAIAFAVFVLVCLAALIAASYMGK